jgi:hypothetical protein
MDTLPEDLDQRIHSELQANERLVWAGQPRPGRFMRSTIPLVLFGIPWTAFAIFWIAAASGIMFGGFGGGPDGFGGLFACFPLFGIPFVLVGVGMLTSPFWMYRRAQRTCYALTDQRAIVWAAGWFGGIEVRSFNPAALGRMTRRDHADGSGDLIFEEVVSMTRNSDGYMQSYRTERGFLGIENVREVENLVRRTLLSAK